MKPSLFAFSGAVLVIALTSGWIAWRFGSVSKAMAFFDGSVILVESSKIDIGTLPPKTLHPVGFKLTNLDSKSIRIAGANVSCTCVVPKDLPMTIEPGKEACLTFNFRSPPTEMRFEETIELFVDGPVAPIQLSILGQTVNQ